jgi:hypothetical protein
MKRRRYNFLALLSCMFVLPGLHAQFGPPPPPPPPPPLSQEGPPLEVVGDMARSAYLDGVKAAHQDLDGGLKPDPRKSSLFRHPPVPPPAWADYRDAFGHGYQAGLNSYSRRDAPLPPPPPPDRAGPPPPPSPPPSAYQEGPPPSVVGDMARHAYLDGMKAAHQDVDGGFKPDPRRSSLFRNPPVPAPAWEDYRSAFGHGYQDVLDHYGRR